MKDTTKRITPADLEVKLREITGDVEEKGEAAKPTVMMVAGLAVVAVVAVAYLLGRRRGRRRSTVVEIRRV
ncbi:MAG: hypothetical protein ACRDY5_09280 [Acidimicrobiales bacterium]